MKTQTILKAVAILILGVTIQSCNKKDTVQNPTNNGILPSKFKVDLPSSISSGTMKIKSGLQLKSAEADTVKGSDVYNNLNTFIAVGEGAAKLVESIIGGIVMYRIDKPMIVTYESNDDNRAKNLVVTKDAQYNGKSYQFRLTISDAASEGSADGGKGMQIFWNSNPIDGIAILKPYNIDRVKNAADTNAIFRIEYSEVPTNDYDSHMIIEIAGLPMPDANLEPYAIHSLKMFAGKKGDNVDVFGNSDHPNAKFFTQDKGFDWAFVASGLEQENIAVAEVGLPPCTLDVTTRAGLLSDYSVKSVLTTQINNWFFAMFGMHPDSTDLAKYLHNADAPGFFSNQGFVQAGTSPTAAYDPLILRIEGLSPFSPKAVHELNVDFQ